MEWQGAVKEGSLPQWLLDLDALTFCSNCSQSGYLCQPGSLSVADMVLCLQRQSNASQTLCDVIRLSRDQSMQLQDVAEPDPLLAALES